MKLVVLGATGKTGVHVVAQALAAGHDVTAFVRSPHKLKLQHKKLRVVQGNARSANDLRAALKGQDAVISVIGSNKPGDTLMSEATKALIQTMQKSHVKRIVLLSSFLAHPHFEKGGIKKIIGRLMRGLTRDKTTGEAILKASDLDWTIVYATRLDGVKEQGYHIIAPNEPIPLRGAIARADVARFMLGQLSQPGSIKQTYLITAD